MDFSIELAVSLAAAFNVAFGALLSLLVEKAPKIKELWKKVKKEWKPWVFLLIFVVVIPSPLLFDLIGTPDYLLNWMAWLPSTDPTWGNLLFAEVMAVAAWLSGTAFFLKKLDEKKDG